MEAQEKSHKENLEQLRKKLVQEREQLIREQNMMLEKKLQVGLLTAWRLSYLGTWRTLSARSREKEDHHIVLLRSAPHVLYLM